MTETRKLSNILFANIAGYTSLMHGGASKAFAQSENVRSKLQDGRD